MTILITARARCLISAGIAAGIAACGPAIAQQAGLSVLSEGENFTVLYGQDHRLNMVGGGAVLSVTGGENGAITYRDAAAEQPPMLAQTVSEGEGLQILYSAPQPRRGALAGVDLPPDGRGPRR